MLRDLYYLKKSRQMLFTKLRILIASLCLNVITKSLFKKRSTFYAVRKEVYLYFKIKVFRELLLVFISFSRPRCKKCFYFFREDCYR